MSQRPTPDHRYRAARAAIDTVVYERTGELEIALHALLRGTKHVIMDVEYAYDLFSKPDHRGVLDAFILAQANFDQTSKALRIPVTVLRAYEHLFMDTSVFRNKLEALSYAQDYVGSAYCKELMKTAVTVGPLYLLWAFGNSDDLVDTRHVVRHTMLDSFFRGMAHKGNALTSAIAKEAQKWMQTAIKNAEILERIDPRTTKEASEELRLALAVRDTTLAAVNSPVPVEDILH